MFGFLGKLFVGFLGVVAGLGGVGWWMSRKKGSSTKDQIEEAKEFERKAVNNMVDRLDSFTLARPKDEDENED